MRKSFFLGILVGCLFSVLLFIGYYEITSRISQNKIPSTEVQQQVIRNIQEINELLIFADDNLAEYTDNLQQAREVLLKTEENSYLSKEDKHKIISLLNKNTQIIEKATYNTIPVFLGNNDGEYNRVIPVTLDATKPSYKLNISCMKFNRDVISTFINHLDSKFELASNIAELDTIISDVSIERAQLAAYQNRLTYSIEIAEALSKTNMNESQVAIKRVANKIKTEQLVLCVQSANGIYCSEDRQQIQVGFDELNNELNRIGEIINKVVTRSNSISLLSQSDAENAMLYLVGESRNCF